jgi:prefoldin subunit 5
MNELTAYLDSLEERILSLERENQSLQTQKETLNRYI